VIYTQKRKKEKERGGDQGGKEKTTFLSKGKKERAFPYQQGGEGKERSGREKKRGSPFLTRGKRKGKKKDTSFHFLWRERGERSRLRRNAEFPPAL